jgi:ribosomal protein L40E
MVIFERSNMSKFCVKCGTKMDKEEKNCPKCGMKSIKLPVPAQLKKRKKKIITITSVAVVLIAVVTILIVYFANSSLVLSDIFTGLRGKTIITVNGYKVPENEFRFFCSLVLEDEDLIYHYMDSDDFDEVIKTEAKQFITEYICRLSEAKEKGFKLTKEEEKKLVKEIEEQHEKYKEETGMKSEREFYNFFYGISKKQFLEFRKNWAIIDKYNTAQEDEANVGLENQQKAFEKYKDFLYSKKTMILVRNIEELDEDELEKEMALINRLYDDIMEGEDMYSLIKGYGQDESVLQSEGIVMINSAYKDTYPELYEWSQDAEVDDVDIIETDDYVYIVKCVEIVDFESLKDTDEMKDWTKFFVVNENIEELMKSDKYKVKVNEKNYNNLDISDLTNEALDYFKTIWGF